MGIDLGNVPLIGGGAPAVAGGYISEFGSELMQFGETLGRIAANQQRNPVQNSLLDAQAAKEIIAAKSLVYANVNEFNKELENNTDYEHFGEAWNSQKAAINDQVSPILTTEESKQKFQEWWLTEGQKQTGFVMEQARNRTVAAAQAQGVVSMDEAVKRGNEGEVKDITREMVSRGLWNKDEAMRKAEQALPEARYNLVLNHLDSLDDPNAAIDTLTNAEATKRFNLDPKQVTNMVKHFEDQVASKQKLTDAHIKEQQHTTFTDFLARTADPTQPLSREEVNKILPIMIGSPQYNDVKSYQNALDTEIARIAKEKIERGMTANYSQMKTALINWDGNGKPPVDANMVDSALRSDDPNLRITEVEADKLTNMYESALKEVQSGSRRGPAFEDQVKIQAAWEIARDVTHGWTATEKQRRLTDGKFLGNGVPGAVYTQIWNSVDDLEQNPDRKKYIEPIQNYYRAQMAALEIKAGPEGRADMQNIAYRQFIASQTMQEVFRKYPTDESKWKDALDTLMKGKIQEDINKQITEKLQGRFPGFFEGGMSKEMRMEIGREQLGQSFATSPAAMAEWRSNLPKIQEEEKSILASKGIKDIVDMALTKSGDTNYRTKNGDIYKVGSGIAPGPFGEAIRPKIYKYIGGKWVEQ